MIYLDNAATTPLCKNAGEALLKYSYNDYYNPSAIYMQGQKTLNDIESAKQTIARALGVSFSNNIIFTSCATEANNMAIRCSYRKNFGKMLFSLGEHPSVYNTACELKKHGALVEFVKLQANGEVDYLDLENKLDDSVSFISIMHCSNETGAINDLKRISELKNQYCPNAIFHSDGVQAFGKFKISVDYFGVDMYTISGHKAFGPKGIGALYVKDKTLLTPVLFGGGQEYNLRSGTENTASIMAFKSAVEDFGNLKNNFEHTKNCAMEFLNKLPNIKVNSNIEKNPYVLSLSFDGVNGETLVHMMEQHNVLISRGSACSSKKSGNRVLENMGLSPEHILGSVRISFCKNSNIQEAKEAGECLNRCYNELLEKLK